MPGVTLVTADACCGPGNRQLTEATWIDVCGWAWVGLNVPCKHQDEENNLLRIESACWVSEAGTGSQLWSVQKKEKRDFSYLLGGLQMIEV